MDEEEEELDNTLIGQEEEAPSINTEGVLMGNIPSDNLVSFVNTTGQQSDAMTQLADTASTNIGVPMTGMRPIDPTTGEPLSQRVIDAANQAGVDLPQASVPLPQFTSVLPAVPATTANQLQAPVVAPALETTSIVTLPAETLTAVPQGQIGPVASPFLQSPNTPSGLGGPLLRGFEMVNDAAREPNAPMGQDETRARLGGMTLNEYLNAPAETPGVSGLRTDPQGRMVPNIGQFQAQPVVTQAPVDSAVPSATAQPPASALSSFEDKSLERQQRIGGTGSFEGDSAMRENILRANQRQPGETQTERDTRIAESRVTGGQTAGLSFEDARRRAEGELARRGVRNPSSFQINALARTIQDEEPERLVEQATQKAKDDITIIEGKTALADTDSFNTSISNSTSAEGVVDYNKALGEYVRGGGSNRGYLEFLRKGQELAKEAEDAGRTPEIKVIEIGGFKALLQDGKYMTGTTIGGDELSTSAIRTLQGRIELLEDAEKDYFSGDPDRKRKAERTITALDIKGDFGAQLTAKDYFEPDAVNKNDNSGTGNDQSPNPNTLTPEQRLAYREQYGIN